MGKIFLPARRNLAAIALMSLAAQIAPAMADELVVPRDALGVQWNEREYYGQWRGTWVRRGFTNTFDAAWINPRTGGIAWSTLTMAVRGNTVNIRRTDPQGTCNYDGTFWANGAKVSGKYNCSWNPTLFDWSAEIDRKPRTFDLYGRYWNETENLGGGDNEFWGRWTRRPNTRVYDFELGNRLGKKQKGQANVRIEGLRVFADRQSPFGICRYEGVLVGTTLAEVYGFYSCGNLGTVRWKALVYH